MLRSKIDAFPSALGDPWVSIYDCKHKAENETNTATFDGTSFPVSSQSHTSPASHHSKPHVCPQSRQWSRFSPTPQFRINLAYFPGLRTRSKCEKSLKECSASFWPRPNSACGLASRGVESDRLDLPLHVYYWTDHLAASANVGWCRSISRLHLSMSAS